ncbi:reverse transcriptase domain-containing protein [Tanacetum coccineum]
MTYDNQSKERKDNSSKALDVDLVVTESNETESERYVLSSRSGNDTHTDDADINSVNDKPPMAEIQEKVFANVALKNELRKLNGNSVDTKFAKQSILGKPVLQPPRNQSIVRQLNAFKSERPNFLKPRFASQVNVNNVLSKPVTPSFYLPKFRELCFAKPQHVIALGSSRNSYKESYGSNDMAHDYYIEEAKKKTQDKNRNLKPMEMAFAKTHNTRNACTPKPRSNNQTSRNWPASKKHAGRQDTAGMISEAIFDTYVFDLSKSEEALKSEIHSLLDSTSAPLSRSLEPSRMGLVDKVNHIQCTSLRKLLWVGNKLHAGYACIFVPDIPRLLQRFSDPTLFIRRDGKELLLVQIYVDDIIFAASTPKLCDLFSKIMCSKFKMSMIGKILFFLGLQISQSPKCIFINQSKYAFESLKKYGFDSGDLVDTQMVEKSKLDEDKKGKPLIHHTIVI